MVFDFEQPSLYLGKISRDGSITKSSFILVKDMAATSVLEVNPTSEFITAKILDFTDNNGKYDRMKMEVTVLPGLPLGRINETITVKTNLEDKPTALLRLTGSVIGDVEVTPEWMTFVVTDTSSTRQANLTKKIFITSHVEGANLEIIEIQDSEGHLDLDLKPLSKGNKYELTATLKPESIPAKGNINGNVVLTTNFPSQKEVAIRYSAVRKSYNRNDRKKSYSGKKKSSPAGASRREGQSSMKDRAGEEGLFAPTGIDPFAPGSELAGKEAEAGSTKDSGKKKPLADTETDGDSDKKKKEKEETTPKQ